MLCSQPTHELERVLITMRLPLLNNRRFNKTLVYSRIYSRSYSGLMQRIIKDEEVGTPKMISLSEEGWNCNAALRTMIAMSKQVKFPSK